MPVPARVPARPLALVLVPLVLALLMTAALGLVQPPAASAGTTGQAVVDRAAQEYGKPYAWGATGPGSFDCSGFTGYVYRQFGISLPRTSRDQYAAVPHVPTGQEQPGDLIFTYNAGGIYHVGIYAGNGQQWAATKTGDIVRPQSMFSRSYYVGRPAGVTAATSAIMAHWSALGGAGGVLGAPVSGELPTPGKAGSYTHFQRGSIYASSATPAREVHGMIRDEWARLGWEGSALGFPVTDELPAGAVRFNHFQGGSVYWSAGTGAHEVRGSIRALWAGLGWERSVLGLPTSGELPADGGRYNRFQGGSVYWSPSTGAHEVHGLIAAQYLHLGAERSALGYPVSDETAAAGSARVSRFEHGTISWTLDGGTVVRTG